MRSASVPRARKTFGSKLRVPASCVVFTPPSLATGMVRALGDFPQAMWLEPCVGQGAFLKALAAAQVPPCRIRALDIDRTASTEDRLARTLRGREFFQWRATTEERFDRVVANPPFAALNRMPRDVQRRAVSLAIPGTNTSVGLGANAWFAFLCASIGVLRTRGSLAFVLPAAWDYADYAATLRHAIGGLFEEVVVHRCRQPLFESVLDGSIVLIARGYRGHSATADATMPLHRRKYNTPERLIENLQPSPDHGSQSCERPRVVTMTGEAFTSDPGLGLKGHSRASTHPQKLQLGDVIQIRLGGVTGDARFFVLSEDQRKRLGLPVAACRPIVSRARHLSGGVVGKADWQRLRDDGERVWLFDPPASQSSHPAVAAYLDRPATDGGCNRLALKIRSRQPWFRTPLEPTIDGFMSGMSGWGPWVVFRQMPRLAATNTLYLVKFLDAATRDERAAWAMWLLTSDAARRLRRIARRYADGLVKFEPGDLAELPIQKPIRHAGAYEAYKLAVRLLLQGKKGSSRRKADAWFSSSRTLGS